MKTEERINWKLLIVSVLAALVVFFWASTHDCVEVVIPVGDIGAAVHSPE